jgi:urease accessory protein
LNATPTLPSTRKLAIAAAGAGFALISTSAQAHTGTGLPGGFVAGFRHPLSGVDHLLAMVSVGIWGAFLGRPLIYLLPVIFPAVMAFGAVLAMVGLWLPPVEKFIYL